MWSRPPCLQVVCHGLLSKKLDRDESGKRSQNRSWRQFYVVLSAGKLFFYKDMKDAVLVSGRGCRGYSAGE